MRRETLQPPSFAVLIALTLTLLLAAAPRSFADAYSLTVIEHTDKEAFIGMDSASDFIVNRSNTLGGSTCGTTAHATSCYETFYAGGSNSVFTADAPNFAFDNGSPCTPSLAGFNFSSGVCNGTHYLASGIYTRPGNQDLRGIWGGPNPDPVQNYLSNGILAGAFMNASGDAVFIDTYNDTLVFARDLSTSVTPEPTSLALLGTGALALLGAVRRRALPLSCAG